MSDRRIQVRACHSTEEMEKAVDLASKVFGPNYLQALKRAQHDFKLNQVKPQDVLIAKLGQEVCGSLTLVKRKLKLFDQIVDVAGVMFVSVSWDHKGLGLGRLLMESAIEELKRRQELLSVLFAARAVDGFYEKFGYLGTGYFNEVIVEKDVYRTVGKTKRFAMRPGVMGAEWPAYSRLYKLTYQDTPLAFHRDEAWWQKSNDWLRFRVSTDQWINILKGTRLVGYFVHQGNQIIEAASEDPELASQALAAFAKENNLPCLVLKLPEQHACLKYFNQLNHSLRRRRAWNGGHMIRVIDSVRFGQLLIEYIERRYTNIFSQEVIGTSVIEIQKIIDDCDVNDTYQANPLLFKLSSNTSNLMLRDVGEHLRNNWSLIDGF